MHFLKNTLASFARDQDGATLVEYGIALGLAITLGAGAMTFLGKDVSASMESARCALPSHDSASVACPT